MIVRPRPPAWQLFFILRGSIVTQIAPTIAFLAAFSVLIVFWSQRQPSLANLPLPPFSLLGLALSVFLGFRNNACYERWWEARKHWGELVTQARNISRELRTLLPEPAQRESLVREVAAFAHALKARLRDEDAYASALSWLSAEARVRVRASVNPPEAILGEMQARLAQWRAQGVLSDFLYSSQVQTLQRMAGIQAACERIRYTPMPFAYSLLLHRTAWLFCLLLPFGLAGSLGWFTPLLVIITAYTFFGLDALGDELEEPFGLSANDLPLNALVRQIERDVLASLDMAELPPPLLPQDFLLQ